MSFGEHLQALREKVGLTQAQLAAKARISLRSLQNWEIDRYRPNLAAVLQMAQALGVDVGELARGMKTPGKPRKPRGRQRKGK